VFFAVLALAMGLPTPDAESAFDMASHEVTVLLQQGKDESACADLAKSLIDEVTNKVDSANKLLADLDDGSDCSSKGQDAVTTATTNKENAEKAATEAASAASSAAATEVDMGSYSFSALTEGTCTQFWSDPSYTAAQKTAADAATAQTDADAEVKAAESSLQAAQEQAAKDVKTCQCAVRTSYDTAFAEATKKASDDAAAFTKGKHMECVLKGTPAAKCVVGDVPAVTPITLAEGVPDQCVPEDTSSSDTQEPEWDHSKPGWDQAANTLIDYTTNMGSFYAKNSGRSCTGTCWETVYGSELAPAIQGDHKFAIGISQIRKDKKMIVGITTNEDNNSESIDPWSKRSYGGCAISDTFETGCFGYIAWNGYFQPKPKNTMSPANQVGNKLYKYDAGDKVEIELDIGDKLTYATFYRWRKGTKTLVGKMSKETAKLPPNAKFRVFVSMINNAPSDSYNSKVHMDA